MRKKAFSKPMQKIWLVIFSILILLGILTIFLSTHKPAVPIVLTPINLPTSVIHLPNTSEECDQSATTTDCAALEAMNHAATHTPAESDQEYQLGYQNEKLGLMFTFPTKNIDEPKYWGDGTGDSFQATIPLASGGVIYAYATSKDFVSEKDGFPVGTEGFVKKAGKYYAISRGKPANVALQVDAIWTLADGEEVPVQFANDDKTNSEYSYHPMAAYLNLQGPQFTGITFTLYPENMKLPSAEDIAAFKRVVTSARHIQ
jgi:hypothetical protein